MSFAQVENVGSRTAHGDLQRKDALCEGSEKAHALNETFPASTFWTESPPERDEEKMSELFRYLIWPEQCNSGERTAKTCIDSFVLLGGSLCRPPRSFFEKPNITMKEFEYLEAWSPYNEKYSHSGFEGMGMQVIGKLASTTHQVFSKQGDGECARLFRVHPNEITRCAATSSGTDLYETQACPTFIRVMREDSVRPLGTSRTGFIVGISYCSYEPGIVAFGANLGRDSPNSAENPRSIDLRYSVELETGCFFTERNNGRYPGVVSGIRVGIELAKTQTQIGARVLISTTDRGNSAHDFVFCGRQKLAAVQGIADGRVNRNKGNSSELEMSYSNSSSETPEIGLRESNTKTETRGSDQVISFTSIFQSSYEHENVEHDTPKKKITKLKIRCREENKPGRIFPEISMSLREPRASKSCSATCPKNHKRSLLESLSRHSFENQELIVRPIRRVSAENDLVALGYLHSRLEDDGVVANIHFSKRSKTA